MVSCFPCSSGVWQDLPLRTGGAIRNGHGVTVSRVAGIGAVAQGKESFLAPEQARKTKTTENMKIFRKHPR